MLALTSCIDGTEELFELMTCQYSEFVFYSVSLLRERVVMRYSVLEYLPKTREFNRFIRSLSADMFCRVPALGYYLVPMKYTGVYMNEFYLNNDFTPGEVSSVNATSIYFLSRNSCRLLRTLRRLRGTGSLRLCELQAELRASGS